jgi:hypothetical protein
MILIKYFERRRQKKLTKIWVKKKQLEKYRYLEIRALIYRKTNMIQLKRLLFRKYPVLQQFALNPSSFKGIEYEIYRYLLSFISQNIKCVEMMIEVNVALLTDISYTPEEVRTFQSVPPFDVFGNRFEMKEGVQL